jgi:hypothetical protein
MKADSMFGWKPQAVKHEVTPIPLCFSLVDYNTEDVIRPERILYLGPRYLTSLQMHECFCNKSTPLVQMKRTKDNRLVQTNSRLDSYSFKLPKALKGMLKYEDAQTDFANNMSANDSKHEKLRRQL